MEHILLYSTMSDKDEAVKIGKILVEERLVACVNIFDPVQSFYWWDGSAQSGQEAVLIAKTRKVKCDAVIQRIVELHSYECPAVVAMPIDAGHLPFLQWIEKETAEQAEYTEG